jgi:hypothetical protein
MSGFPYNPPTWTSSSYNSNAFPSYNQIVQQKLVYLTAITPGTASAGKALIVDASRDITTINNLTTNGAIGCVNTSTNSILTLQSTNTSGRSNVVFQTDNQIWEFGARGSTSGNPNTMYWYNGGYRMFMSPAGIISINTTQVTSRMNLGGVGALGIQMNNDTTTNNKSAFIGTNSSASFIITAQDLVTPLAAQYNFQTNGNVSLGNRAVALAAPRCALDFGAASNDMLICLYGASGAASSVYALGANNSALESHTGGDFTWYNNSLLTGSTLTLGTKRMTLTGGGDLTIHNGSLTLSNVCQTSVDGYGYKHFSGSGVEVNTLATASTIGGIGTYSNHPFQIYTNHQTSRTTFGTNGYINVNTANTSCSFPLSVFGTSTATRSGTFGWLNGSGTGVSTGFTNRSFTIYSEGGILVDSGEIDSFSDIRLKTEVKLLDDDLCDRFVRFINPISFRYKHNDSREHYGFSAQELMRFGFDRLVGFTDTDKLLPPQVIECYEPDPEDPSSPWTPSGKSIEIPSDVRLTVTQLDMIPILLKCIQTQHKRIDKNTAEIERLYELIPTGKR